MQIDFDGLQQRIIAVPGVPARDYSQLTAGGRRHGVSTSRRRRAAAAATLQRYRLSDRRAAPFVTGVADYVISADGAQDALSRRRRWRRRTWRRRRRRAPPPGPRCSSSTPIATRRRPARDGSTSRCACISSRKEEFKQIFNEGWRNQRDYLYVPNMHGADWTKMEEMYGQMLPHVNHRADLNYLLDNMGAEIAVGHSYVRGGDMPEVPHRQPAACSAPTSSIENGRYKITRIYDNESWNPELRAPLHAPGVDVNVGDYILAINGVELRAPDNIHRLLDGTANRQTRLTVNSKPAMEGARQVTVVPVASEQGAAHARVGRREPPHGREAVEAASSPTSTCRTPGRADTRASIATTSRSRTRRARSSTSATTAAARRPTTSSTCWSATFDGYFNNVAGDRMPFTSPSAGIWGPKVMIINEMAGSGGDLMPYMFRYRKIGPLVGKRTWGGLVHTADTPGFIDGGSMIAPRGGFFTRDGKWAVENEGVGAGHRRRELAEGRHRRPRSAARTRRRGGDAAAQGEARRSHDEGTAAADVGGAEAGRGRTVRVLGAGC